MRQWKEPTAPYALTRELSRAPSTANNVPLLERFPWKLQRTLLISSCKHCKKFGKGLSLPAEAVGCTPLHTAFFSAPRSLVPETLRTSMAGYTRLLNDFPSSSLNSTGWSSLGPQQGSLMLIWIVLCPRHSSAASPTAHCVPGNQRYKCTLHGMAYISAINSYSQHNPSSGSYSKT